MKKRAKSAIGRIGRPAQRLRRRKSGAGDDLPPRITNDTVAETREQILRGARRFIYPLQHSRKRIITISAGLSVAFVIAFIGLTGYLVYGRQSTSDFAYRLSQILPYPVARVEGRFVSYEDWLFEIRHAAHYHRTQENIDFSSKEGQDILADLKKRSLEKVKRDALVEVLARRNKIKVTREEVDTQIDFIRSQSGIGGSASALDTILEDYWGWEQNDLRRVIRQQILRRKLLSVLDTKTVARANEAYGKLEQGTAFEVVAKEYSDDTGSKEKGGQIGTIARTTTEFPASFIQAAFEQEPGGYSGLVESEIGLHIVKTMRIDGEQAEVAHVLFRYFDMDAYLNEQLKDSGTSTFLKLRQT